MDYSPKIKTFEHLGYQKEEFYFIIGDFFIFLKEMK